MTEVVGEMLPGELDIKRFYMPGVVVKTTCPDCGTACALDLKNNCLFYPKANETFGQDFYCPQEGCGRTFQVRLRLNVTLSVESVERNS